MDPCAAVYTLVRARPAHAIMLCMPKDELTRLIMGQDEDDEVVKGSLKDVGTKVVEARTAGHGWVRVERESGTTIFINALYIIKIEPAQT